MAKENKAPKASKKGASVDDVLEGKTGADDVLEGKAENKAKGKSKDKPNKGKAEKPAPAKKAPAKKSDKPKAKAEPGSRGATTEAVRAAIGKVRKQTSYAELSEAGGFDIRLVRRNARALRDEGAIELYKEGTVVYIKPAKGR